MTLHRYGFCVNPLRYRWNIRSVLCLKMIVTYSFFHYKIKLKSDEVNFVHAHLESDDRIWQYDVEFHKDTTEYDYDIDTLTGEVLSFDHDTEYYHHAQAANAGSEQITEAQAKQLALQHAGVAEKDAQRLQIEFDYDDGRGEYEVDMVRGTDRIFLRCGCRHRRHSQL